MSSNTMDGHGARDEGRFLPPNSDDDESDVDWSSDEKGFGERRNLTSEDGEDDREKSHPFSRMVSTVAARRQRISSRSNCWKPPDTLNVKRPTAAPRQSQPFNADWEPPHSPVFQGGRTPTDVELVVIEQPEEQHRARYMSEGSRGAVKDRSGKSHVVIQLAGNITKPTPLEIFAIMNDPEKTIPHPLYKVIPVTGKGTGNTTPCIAVNKSNVDMIQVMLRPEDDMKVVLDCLGILKVCGYKVKHGGSKDHGRAQKSSTLRLAFRATVANPLHGNFVDFARHEDITIQTVSEPIKCLQQLGQPEVTKASLRSCPARGGQDLFLIGRNFAKTATVTFREINEEGKIVWSCDAPCQSSFSNQCHLICTIPTYRSLCLTEPVAVSMVVVCGDKSSPPVGFQYSPTAEQPELAAAKERKETTPIGLEQAYEGALNFQTGQQFLQAANVDLLRNQGRKRPPSVSTGCLEFSSSGKSIASIQPKVSHDMLTAQRNWSENSSTQNRPAGPQACDSPRKKTGGTSSHVLNAQKLTMVNPYLSSLLLGKSAKTPSNQMDSPSRANKFIELTTTTIDNFEPLTPKLYSDGKQSRSANQLAGRQFYAPKLENHQQQQLQQRPQPQQLQHCSLPVVTSLRTTQDQVQNVQSTAFSFPGSTIVRPLFLPSTTNFPSNTNNVNNNANGRGYVPAQPIPNEFGLILPENPQTYRTASWTASGVDGEVAQSSWPNTHSIPLNSAYLSQYGNDPNMSNKVGTNINGANINGVTSAGSVQQGIFLHGLTTGDDGSTLSAPASVVTVEGMRDENVGGITQSKGSRTESSEFFEPPEFICSNSVVENGLSQQPNFLETDESTIGNFPGQLFNIP